MQRENCIVAIQKWTYVKARELGSVAISLIPFLPLSLGYQKGYFPKEGEYLLCLLQRIQE
jgi:hypothetical protein